ncbi:peptidase inhibitor family I36 protein (plasmid) [Kitasatospora purpeofusca]|uniref:peptidase inhibitor family I36 protein n=1 Tax=Kitasatospora purpeofusca TaxID=67352 RepID=UPI002E0FB514|nr:peptidase inhibitor family I36 protein [Kitasatospora purpeofusca]
MKLRMLAAGAGAAVLLVGWAVPAQAAGQANPGVTSGVVTPEEDARNSEGLATSDGEATVLHRGQKVKISTAWEQGAQACVEFAVGDNRCFDSTKDADLATAAFDATQSAAVAGKPAPTVGQAPTVVTGTPSCSSGWVCLWSDINYDGRKLQWSAAGQKNLADWTFRDQASSACNGKTQGGFTLYDARDFMLDPEMIIGANGCVGNFTTVGYPYGGNWNDKADYIQV